MSYDDQRSSLVSPFLWWWKVTLYQNGGFAGICYFRQLFDAQEAAGTWSGTFQRNERPGL